MNAFIMLDNDIDWMYWGCIEVWDTHIILTSYMLDIYGMYPEMDSMG